MELKFTMEENKVHDREHSQANATLQDKEAC